MAYKELTNIRITTPIIDASVTAQLALIPEKGEVVAVVPAADSADVTLRVGDGTNPVSGLSDIIDAPALAALETRFNSHNGNKSNPHGVTKAQVGLGNVENLNRASILASAPLTGTPTAPTAAAGTNTTQVATTAFVNTAIGSGIAASDAMIFKGTLGTSGTVTALPTTYKTGWTYRVITAGTYAGNVCEIGDLIIALVDRAGSNNANSDWTVAQTNINGALTNVTGTAPISVTGSGATRAIGHANSGVTAGTFSKVTVNATGHVTAGSNPTATIAEGGTANTSYTANTVLVYDGTKFASSAITTTKLGYLTDVTSNIQAQLNGKAASSHTHNYAGSSAAGGAANSVKAALAIQTNGTAFKSFNGSAATTVNIAAGSNVTITPDAANNKITIASSFTNTDTKVTNTLEGNTKFYITGSKTATTNTGTQIFDTDVYIENKTLHATTLSGALAADKLVDGTDTLFLRCSIS